jgi:hypothetical protein
MAQAPSDPDRPDLKPHFPFALFKPQSHVVVCKLGPGPKALALAYQKPEPGPGSGLRQSRAQLKLRPWLYNYNIFVMKTDYNKVWYYVN